MKSAVPALLCLLALTACTDREAELKAQQAAQAQHREQAADELARNYEKARADGQWQAAFLHGNALLRNYAGTAAAARVEQTFAEVRARAEAKREADRLSSLWSYVQVPVAPAKGSKGGTQYSAMIDSKTGVDVDGRGERTVQLVFRDHPAWKRSSYLVLQAGDFAKACYAGCKVEVTGDDGKAIALKAWRPKTDEAIAMFIEDDKRLWKLARANKALRVAFRTRDTGTKTAVFETGGVLPERMPGW